MTNANATKVDPWAVWRALLSGNNTPLTDEVQPGFWLYKTKDAAEFEPVAVWTTETGAITGLRSGEEVGANWLASHWTWFCKHPITKEEYDARIAGTWGIADKDALYGEPPASFAGVGSRGDRLLSAVQNIEEVSELADAAHAAKSLLDIAKALKDEQDAPFKSGLSDIKTIYDVAIEGADKARKFAMSKLRQRMERENLDRAKGSLGKAISWRERTVIDDVTDKRAALDAAFEIDPDAFLPVIQKIARAQIKQGGIAGVTTKTERSIA